MGYLRKAAEGVTWMAGLRFGMRGLTFVRVFILARLLTPAQFGTYGVATLVLSFVEVLTEAGINLILVQEDKKLFDKYLDSAWIVSIGRGLLMFAVIFVLAPVIGNFFDNPDSVQIVRLIALVPLIKGFINPSVALFTRDLKFRNAFAVRTSVSWLGGIVSIVLAFILQSPVSLAIGMIVEAVAEVIVTMIYISPRPHFRFNKTYLGYIFHRGKWITMAGTFNYLFHQLDDIVVGHRLNSVALGSYQMAYRLAILPITEISDVFNQVTFPVFTSISGDKQRLQKAFWKTVGTVALLTVPFGLILTFFPELVVRVFLGVQWTSIVPLLPLLAVFGVLRAITATCFPLFLSVKKQEYVTGMTLWSILGLAVTIWPFVSWWGMYGAGLSALVGTIVALPYLSYRIWYVLYRQN